MKPIVLNQIDEKAKGSKFWGTPSRLMWEEGGRNFVFEYKRREFSLQKTTGRRERSGAFGHVMFGVNQSDDFIVKIYDAPVKGSTQQASIEPMLCKEAENLNFYYDKDCCRVLRRTNDNGFARYYLIMPKERGEQAAFRLNTKRAENMAQPGTISWKAIITQAMHPLYVIAQLHQKNTNTTFIHRDIKPENMISPDVVNAPFKLIDFGTAIRAENAPAGVIEDENLTGTRGCLSPTLYNAADSSRKMVEYSNRSDHYAMAVALTQIFFLELSEHSRIEYSAYTQKIPTGIGQDSVTGTPKMLYHIAQLNDEKFQQFIADNQNLGKDCIAFITWVRPFANGTSENTPEYIEGKLAEYRRLFELKNGQGISTYQSNGINLTHADMNRLSSAPAAKQNLGVEQTREQMIAKVFGVQGREVTVAQVVAAVKIELKRLDTPTDSWFAAPNGVKYMKVYTARNTFEENPTEANAKQLRDALNIKRTGSGDAAALTNVKAELAKAEGNDAAKKNTIK